MRYFGAHPIMCTGSFSVPELVKTDGQIVVLSSAAAQYRATPYSDYCLSKHVLHRLAELVVVGTHTYYLARERELGGIAINYYDSKQITLALGFSVSIRVASRLNSTLIHSRLSPVRMRSPFPRRRSSI